MFLVVSGLMLLGVYLARPSGGTIEPATNKGPAVVGEGVEQDLAAGSSRASAGESTQGEDGVHRARVGEAIGRLQYRDGLPVEGEAHIARLPFVAAPIDGNQEEWGKAPRPAGETKSTDGVFPVLDLPSLGSDGYVLAFGSSFMARAMVPEDLGANPIISVDRGPRLSALVTVRGLPVDAGAVELTARIATPLGPGLASRSFQLRSDGTCELPLFAGMFALRARSGERSSPVWWGTLQDSGGSVVLECGPEIDATVRTKPGEGVDPNGVISVRGPASVGNEIVAISELPSGQTELRVRVPWVGPGDYVFSLEGDGFISTARSATVRTPDDEISVDMVLDAGTEVVFRVVDEKGERCAGLPVTLTWKTEVGWRKVRRVTDAEGRAFFDDCARGRHWLRVVADGYVNESHGPFDIFGDVGGDLVVNVRPASAITGRVTRNGEPESGFSLVVWGGGIRGRTTERIRRSEDGQFGLSQVPSEPFRIAALGEDGSASIPKQVEVTLGQDLFVELELVESERVSGRVVDSAAGLPIAGAETQVWLVDTGSRIEAIGLPVTTGSSGMFSELSVPSPGYQLEVRASGYETRFVGDPGSREFVVIGLSRVQDLLVRVIGSPETLVGTTVSCSAGKSQQAVSLNDDGEAVIPMARGGLVNVALYLENSSRIDVGAMLLPGTPWVVEVPIVAKTPLRGRLDWEGPGPRPEVTWMFLHMPNSVDTSDQVVRVDETGLAEFAMYPGGDGILSASDSTGTRLGTVSFTEQDAISGAIPVAASSEWDRVLEVVDTAGEPVPNAMVVIRRAKRRHLSSVAWTDERGTLHVGHHQDEALEAAFWQNSGWLTNWRPLPGGREGRTRVELVGDNQVTLRATHGGVGFQGVNMTIATQGSSSLEHARTTGPEGLVSFNLLDPAPYDVHVRGDGWWPETLNLTASPDPPLVEVALRRRGALNFVVRQNGLPVSGAAVEVSSSTEGDDFASWITTGQVQATPSSSVTGLKGTVRVLGAPEGPYAWRVTIGELVRTGGVDLQGLEETTVSVDLSE